MKKSEKKKDTDCMKKATTDGLTKCLSFLGFNADIFLGKFDDCKYVQQVTEEFATVELDDNAKQWIGIVKANPAALNDITDPKYKAFIKKAAGL